MFATPCRGSGRVCCAPSWRHVERSSKKKFLSARVKVQSGVVWIMGRPAIILPLNEIHFYYMKESENWPVYLLGEIGSAPAPRTIKQKIFHCVCDVWWVHDVILRNVGSFLSPPAAILTFLWCKMISCSNWPILYQLYINIERHSPAIALSTWPTSVTCARGRGDFHFFIYNKRSSSSSNLFLLYIRKKENKITIYNI